jgi:hypothetical protein
MVNYLVNNVISKVITINAINEWTGGEHPDRAISSDSTLNKPKIFVSGIDADPKESNIIDAVKERLWH